MYIGLVLTASSRQSLKNMFPPKYDDFIGHHVTLEFGVPPNTSVSNDVVEVQVVGHADDKTGIEALVVSVNGTTDRPDGGTYHITWSLDRSKGYKPVSSNKLLQAGFEWLPVPVTTRCTMELLKYQGVVGML
jgi:hypothetical protein